MSVYLYDNALTEKIKYWTEATDVHVYSPEETTRTFEVIADTTGDKPIKLPIICIRRKSGFQLLSVNKEPLSYEGLTLNASYDKGEQLSAIPISIAYQIDVYTRYFKEADEYVKNNTPENHGAAIMSTYDVCSNEGWTIQWFELDFD